MMAGAPSRRRRIVTVLIAVIAVVVAIVASWAMRDVVLEPAAASARDPSSPPYSPASPAGRSSEYPP